MSDVDRRCAADVVPVGIGESAYVELGRRLRSAREAAGLLQAEVAQALGYGRAAYGKWEAGSRGMDVLAFSRACAVVGVTPNALLGVSEGSKSLDAHHRVVRLLEAEGVDLAARTLGLRPQSLRLVVDGKLLIPESQFEGLAEAYGVEPQWLVFGSPRFWKPCLSDSWSSRIRFLKICIGGFIDGGLIALASDMEKSEKLAKRMLASDGEFLSALQAVMATSTRLSRRILEDYPFKVEWLSGTGEI